MSRQSGINAALNRQNKPGDRGDTTMKKMRKTMLILLFLVFFGTFVAAGYASAAGETGRDGRFIAYDDETVLDTRTNLMWAAKDNGNDINWTKAKSYCEKYEGGGYTDWRMPTQNELADLYESAKDAGGYHLATTLITLTACCAWTSNNCLSMIPQYDIAGSYAFTFSFTSGQSVCSHQSIDRATRALPVRFAK